MPEKSCLLGAVDSISPWSTSRSSTPKLSSTNISRSELTSQQGVDHSLSHHHGMSCRRYPKDCPPLNARWFYAVDAPKRKPKILKEIPKDSKPLPPPKKFVPFSVRDSRSLEAAFQQLVEEEENGVKRRNAGENSGTSNIATDKMENTSLNEAGNLKHTGGKVKVPVNEDFLFDVDIEARELAPVYWLGPIYEVRRGSWFYQEGSGARPCEENLATQLEEGYLKVKPFRYPKASDSVSAGPGNDLVSPTLPVEKGEDSSDLTPKSSVENLETSSKQIFVDESSGSTNNNTAPAAHEPQTHRLFGSYPNSIVTYQDETTAWLSSDDLMSRVSSTVYQRFAGGGYLGGVKVVRGFTDPTKAAKVAETKSERPSTPNASTSRDSSSSRLGLDEMQQTTPKRRSAPPGGTITIDVDESKESKRIGPETQEALLKRQISSMVVDSMDPGEEETVRRRDEKEIQTDYVEHDGEDQARQIEHLILVTHGIGQRLGMRAETVNFVHDVNVLRQNLKNVYSNSADLQALNTEIDKMPKNCRIQVLPVCWRHLLDFPRQSLKQSRKEQDIGDISEDDEEYPSLEDITIVGVPFVRNLITDLALDILLYQSAYREHICAIVFRECNRIHKLFLDRNPHFKGKVSLIGHSLGSAILFDLLCRQKECVKVHESSPHSKYYCEQSHSRTHAREDDKDLSFQFAVEDFYCLGSPIGLFQMLKGRTIAARRHPGAFPAESPMDSDNMDDPFVAASSSTSHSVGDKISSITGLPYTISSPKCAQLYNIFHPSDPISYRLEPLVTPAMSSLKPQALPYTKKGIFGSAASQGLTGIGARVGQSVSEFWSGLSSGIANSILNRNLGLTGEEVASMAGPSSSTAREPQMSIGVGTDISSGSVSPIPPLVRENTSEKKRQLAENTTAADREGSKFDVPTLIDDEIETLYSGFQKGRESQQSDKEQSHHEAEEKGRRLRIEELKVRGLNHSGRIDFSIQESVLDFNPISTIASHLSYWADEDVSHFIMSQLLSRHRARERRGSSDHPSNFQR